MKIAKEQKRLDRAEQYEALVAEEKKQNATMQKKIFEFLGNLEMQAAAGKFEESKLEEPIAIPEKVRPEKDAVMKKKESKIDEMQAKVGQFDEEAQQQRINSYNEAKDKSQKSKEVLKREKLEELTGIPLADPKKLEELE